MLFRSLTLWGITGGSSSIEWRQLDEQEWEVRVGIVLDIVKVKKVIREIENEMKKYGYVSVDLYDDDSSPRFKRSVKFIHQSHVKAEDEIRRSKMKEMQFGAFFNSFMKSCISLQGNKRAVEGSEDDKTVYIRDLLTQENYNALDQTLRGSSESGKRAGEVDLLIQDNNKVPLCIIEALVLRSIDTKNIDSHINKIAKYDTNGLDKNIVLNYVFTPDFDDFVKRYINHVSTAKLDAPLSNLNDISNPRFSEVRIYVSEFIRSGMKRELIHVLLNLPTK